MGAARLSIMGLLLVFAALPAQADLEVIPLKHRTAEQVVPTLRSFVEPGGALQGMNNQIIIRASPGNIAEIRHLLASIDTPLRRLVISVRQDGGGRIEQRGASVSGSIGADHGRVVIGDPPPGSSGIGVRIQDTHSTTDERIVQQVQALEGSPALIQIGQSVPVPTRTLIQTITGPVVTDTVTYRDLSTGFEVIPRVSGDRVTLEISPQRETPGLYAPGSANVQRIVTTASGRLGEWFELGAIVQDEAREQFGILSGASGARLDNRRVWVKVDEIQ